MTDSIHSVLKQHWGYDSFRPRQEEIINSILSGRDTIGLLPTGGGKSITFQVPALMIDGLTLVITPLISLMKDQVDNLRQRHIPACYLHAALTRRESELVIDRCRLGKAKMLYLSPEKLVSKSFVDTLRQLPVKMIVVDEAHCISQWGYDFRPSYLKIAELRKLFPSAPVLALTASATPEVVDDIARQLGMKSPAVFRLSFTRKNLSYIVRYADNKEGKLVEILSRVGGCAIVYVRSRKRTREIAQALCKAGISASFYHAGLAPEEKEERQNAWKNDEVRVMVATNAFGMGIDKPDVRIVVHVDLPSSLEEYYQEAGRAGRDGLESLAVIVASRHDKATLKRRLAEAFPDKDLIRSIYNNVGAFLDIPMGEGYNTVNEFNLPLFCQRHNLHPVAVNGALKILSQSGYIDYSEQIETRSRVMMLVTKEDLYGLDLLPTTERVLNALLRNYTGLFADYVYISESVLSSASGLTEEQVYEGLLALSRHHALHYVPKKVAPYIFYATSREEPRYLVIPRSVYEERQQQMKHRIDSMIDFAYRTDQCRVNSLLRYFGETPTGDCGKCDVCRANRKAADNSSDIERQLLYMLRHGNPIKVTELLPSFNVPGEKLTEIIREMVDDGRLRLEGDAVSAVLTD